MNFLIIASAMLLAVEGIAATNTPAIEPATGATVGSASASKSNYDDAAFQRGQHSVAFSLEHGHTPREWALGWILLESIKDKADYETKNRGALLRKAAEVAPKDRLVQWMWSRAAQDASGCDTQHPCPDRVATFARIEPNNGAAWVSVFNAAWIANDVPGAESALSSMAQSDRFNEPIGDEFKAWEDYFDDFPSASLVRPLTPFEKVEDSKAGMAFVETSDAPFPEYFLLVRACDHAKQPNATTTRLENCGKVGRLMLEGANQFFGRRMGAALIRLSGTATPKDLEAGRNMLWLYEQMRKLFARMGGDATVFRDYLTDFERSGSDIEAVRDAMRRAQISMTPPADWHPTDVNGAALGPLGELIAPPK